MDQLTPVVAAPPQRRPERQATVADREPVITDRVNRTWTWPSRLALVVLGLLLVAVGILAWTAWRVYDHNEDRLLDLKAKEAASVVTAALPSIQTPLASAAALANATNADPHQFDTLMAPYVGPGKSFASASLWSLRDPSAGPVVTIGPPPVLASDPSRGTAFFQRASTNTVLSVLGLLNGPSPRLGYEFNVSAGAQGYAAYAERALPENRKLAIASNSAFSDLNFALYLGRSTRTGQLLGATVALPITGRQATTVIPFGDSAFTLTVTPKGSLSGTLSRRLPWIIAVVGTILALIAAVVAEGLVRRRQRAERLAASLDQVAAENRRLYTEQRSIAQTLQHALLPDHLPRFDGADAWARYLPGVQGMDVGGDWYDLIRLDGDHAMFVVGDVSGRGLRAATVMASLRYALRGYAAQGDPPEAILSKLSALVSVEEDGHFATVLCAQIDLPAHRIRLANAGHPPPLLTNANTRLLVAAPIGVPVGVTSQPRYTPVEVTAPPGAVFLGFTDGLIERRGEPIDVGLKRLCRTAPPAGNSLEAFVTGILDGLAQDGPDDDIAILGVQWRN